MNIRYKYNRQFSPPASCVYVSVARPDGAGQPIEALPAQLDTGADATVVPARIAEQLQLVPTGQREIIGFDGHVAVVPTYLASIAIHTLPPAPVRVLASREEQIILLGRDIMNQHRVLLDGPNLVLEIGSE